MWCLELRDYNLIRWIVVATHISAGSPFAHRETLAWRNVGGATADFLVQH